MDGFEYLTSIQYFLRTKQQYENEEGREKDPQCLCRTESTKNISEVEILSCLYDLLCILALALFCSFFLSAKNIKGKKNPEF